MCIAVFKIPDVKQLYEFSIKYNKYASIVATPPKLLIL